MFKKTCLPVTIILKKGEQSIIFYIKNRFTFHVETLVVLERK